MKFRRTLALDADGDLRIDENREFVFLDGAAGVEQELKTALATVRGEDPFDEEYGLRVFELTGAEPAIIEREVRDTLLYDDRVRSIDEITVDEDPDQRTVDVTVDLTLVDETPLQFTAEV